MHEAGCRIVTRLKKNTKLTVTVERLIEPGLSRALTACRCIGPLRGPILSDRIGLLPARQAYNRRNPFQAEVREIRVRTDNGTELRIVTNDLGAPAQEIAELYKRRWAIELFFRWIKQNLKIRRFMGTSENAVRTQVFIALIAYLLVRLAYDAQSELASMVRFVRIMSENLMEGRSIDELLAALAAARPPRRSHGQPENPSARAVRKRLFGNIFQGVGAIEF